MISKELLSVVINKKIVADDINNIELKENTITFIEDYWDEDEGSGFYRSHTINIYELAHKCKELAYSQGYIISSGLTPVLGVNKDGWAEVFSSSTPLEGKLNTFKQLSEPEAVFKAAQWILDNVKTNSLP